MNPLKNLWANHKNKIMMGVGLAGGTIFVVGNKFYESIVKEQPHQEASVSGKPHQEASVRVGVRQSVRCSNDNGVELDLEEIFRKGEIFYRRLELSPGISYTCRAANNGERVVNQGENSVKMFLLADERYPVNGYTFDEDKGTLTFTIHENDSGLYELILPIVDRSGKIKTRRLEFLVKTRQSLAERDVKSPQKGRYEAEGELDMDGLGIGVDTVYGGNF